MNKLFQASDSILFMDSDLSKKPHTERIITAAAVPGIIDLPAYYSINPISVTQNLNLKGERSYRASINVTHFRNFLFESDSLPLNDQLNLLASVHPRLPFAQVVFSGGSSYHAIISVADTLPFKPHTEAGIASYSQAWKALNAELTEICSELYGHACPARLFDTACKDPARLSRTPGALRPDTNVIQHELDGFGGYISADDIQNLMMKHNLNSSGPAAPKVSQNSSMDLDLFAQRLLYPENLGLKSKLTKLDWISSANMYPELFQLTLWIMDNLGAPLNTTLNFMKQNIFPAIKRTGYPRNPEIAVHNAYIWKGLE
jgi:hypothetical protein